MISGNQDISVLILAAGLSTRMKTTKALLKFDENRRFIDKIVEEYKNFGCRSIIVVLGEKIKNEIIFSENLKFVLNNEPEKGRIHSLKCALKAVEDEQFCFIQNIDNPFVNQETLKLLYKTRLDADCIIPEYKKKGGHPILINRNIIDSIRTTADIDIPLNEYLKKYKLETIECNDASILININDKESYNKYFKNE